MFGIGALGAGHRLRDYEQLDDIKSVHALLRDVNALAAAIELKAVRQGALPSTTRSETFVTTTSRSTTTSDNP